MCKEEWIERYERALEYLYEEEGHEFDPFNVPKYIEELASERANAP